MGLNIAVNKAEKLTSGENKVLEGLKNAYENVEHEVFIYAQQKVSNKRPDFVVIDSKRGILILEVKDWSEDYIRSVNKRKVRLLDDECDNPISQVKGYKNIICGALANRDFENIDESDINLGIVFTNIDEEEKNNEKLVLLFNKDINYILKKDISKLYLDKLFNYNDVDFSNNDLNGIRIALFPEIEIITKINSSCEYIENMDLKALDFEQEEFAKRIPLGNYMVTGVPGSGKTVILLARAIYLIKENPDWRVLILTYNKSLSYKLRSKIDGLAEIFSNDLNNRDINIQNIEVRHFHGELSRLTGGIRKPKDISSYEWFNNEIVNRASNMVIQEYDAILIDEYQDFRMNWIELCVKLCKDYELENGKIVKNIFLAGDRLQSIYNNKDISWKSIGIDMRGRSKLLKTSYRSAKQHMSLALEFLKKDRTLKEEVEKFYKDDSDDDRELGALNDGSLEFITGDFSEISNKILELKEQGYKNEDFLILGASERVCSNIKKHSNDNIKYQMKYVKELDNNNIANNIILTTYHSAKGLEAKVIFLTTMDSIYTGVNTDDQLKRKVVYVGITRGSEKLFIFSEYGDDGILLNELKDLGKSTNANNEK